MSTSPKRSSKRARSVYHHGDLRRSLVAAATEMLEQDGLEALSLREAARRAGVSHNAPYRHFADRQALLAAVAAEGFRLLAEQMEAAAARAGPGERLREIGVAYVCFATAHPAVFNLMFGRGLEGGSHADLHAAGERAFAVLTGQFEASEASSSGRPEIVAAWSVVHGLAHLLIDARLGPRLTGGVGDVAALARAVLAAGGGGSRGTLVK